MQVRFEITEGLGDLRERYQQQLRNQNPTLLALDRLRMDAWRKKEQEGYYLRPLLHAYFHWNPTVHHELPGAAFGKAVTKRFSLDSFSLSASRCIQRTAREHDDVLSEFGSILSGVEQTLRATGMGVRRLTDTEIFLEVKRSLNPLMLDRIPLRRPESSLQHRTTREQIVNTNIEHEEETYIRVGGLLYSFITLKDLPDATFPGILRDLVGLDFPITVNTDVMIPDQAAMIKQYKGRLKKMQAAQRDSHGGFRIDVDAQVAQRQLIETLENLISSSLKTCRTSMVIGVRTSQPVQSHRDLAEQERVLSDRRQKVLYTVMQMNGSRGLPEDLAKRRRRLLRDIEQKSRHALALYEQGGKDAAAPVNAYLKSDYKKLEDLWKQRFPGSIPSYLGRHIAFGMDSDYRDILVHDLPEVEGKAEEALLTAAKGQGPLG